MARSERVVIVTGGARGIGLACARRFSADGCAVVVADIDDEQGRAAQAELEGAGAEALYVHCNVTKRLDLLNMLAATIDSYDRIDVLINNATIKVGRGFFDLSEEDWDKVMATNLKGAFQASQIVAKRMVAQIEDGGEGEPEAPSYSVINLSSIDAILAVADELPFAVSKGGINQLTRAMAVALAQYGIRVNAIAPGNILTDTMKDRIKDSSERQKIASHTPLGRIGAPEEIAGIAAFLASPAASFITGQCIYADGGRLVLDQVPPAGNKSGKG